MFDVFCCHYFLMDYYLAIYHPRTNLIVKYQVTRYLRLGRYGFERRRNGCPRESDGYDMSRALGHGVGEGKDRYFTADLRSVYSQQESRCRRRLCESSVRGRTS